MKVCYTDQISTTSISELKNFRVSEVKARDFNRIHNTIVQCYWGCAKYLGTNIPVRQFKTAHSDGDCSCQSFTCPSPNLRAVKMWVSYTPDLHNDSSTLLLLWSLTFAPANQHFLCVERRSTVRGGNMISFDLFACYHYHQINSDVTDRLGNSIWSCFHVFLSPPSPPRLINSSAINQALPILVGHSICMWCDRPGWDSHHISAEMMAE